MNRAYEVASEAVNRHGAMQTVEELAGLWELVARLLKPGQAVVEVGVARGGTLWAWSELPGKPFVVGVDLPEPTYDRFTLPAHERTRMVYGRSHEHSTRRWVNDTLEERKVGFLFIDADHSYEGVSGDYAAFCDLVVPGGLIAFHDIAGHATRYTEVDRFWAELPGLKLEVLRRPYPALGIGILLV